MKKILQFIFMPLLIIIAPIIAFASGADMSEPNTQKQETLTRPTFTYDFDIDMPDIFTTSYQSNGKYQNTPSYSYNYGSSYAPTYEISSGYQYMYNNNYSSSVYITRTGSCYHKPGCTHAKNPVNYMSSGSASSKGYKACYYCFG